MTLCDDCTFSKSIITVIDNKGLPHNHSIDDSNNKLSERTNIMEPLTIQTTIYLHTTFHRDHCSRERSQADKMLVICNHSSSSEMPTNQEEYKIRHVTEK